MFLDRTQLIVTQKPVNAPKEETTSVCLRPLINQHLEWVSIKLVHSLENSIVHRRFFMQLNEWFGLPISRKANTLTLLPKEPKPKLYYLNVFTLYRYCYELPFMMVFDTYQALYGYEFQFHKLLAVTEYYHIARGLNRGHSLVGKLNCTPELTPEQICERLEDNKPHQLMFSYPIDSTHKCKTLTKFVKDYESDCKSICTPSERVGGDELHS